MIKRLLLYIVAMIILLALAFSAGQWDKDTTLLQQHAKEISEWLVAQETDGLAWGHTHANPDQIGENQSGKPYTVLVHQQDSILAWSNTNAIPAGAALKKIAAGNGRSVIQLPLGWFLVNREQQRNLTVLVPVRYALDVNLLDRGNVFPAGKNIDDNIEVTSTPTDYPIEIDGKPLAWLDTEKSVQSGWLQWVQLIAYLLFFILFFSLLHRAALWMNRRLGPLAGTGLLLISVTLLLWLNNVTGFTQQQFNALPLFAPVFENASLIGRSVGDWLVHAILLVYVMIFFHRCFGMAADTTGEPEAEELLQEPVSDQKTGLKTVLALFGYLLAMLSIPFSVEVMRELVLHSNIGFDFDNILNVGSLGLLAVTGVIILMTGLFLFSHRMLLMIRQLKLPAVQRGIAIAIGAAIVTGIAVAMGLNPLFVAVFAILYVVLFDAFVHWNVSGFGWLVAWLLVFSGFASMQLYRYNTWKDKELRLQYAQALATDQDTMIQNVLPRVLTTFQKDSRQIGLLLKPWPFKATAGTMAAHLNELIFPEHYLFQHYRLRVFAFDRERQPLLLDQSLGYDQVEFRNWSALATASGDVRLSVDEKGERRYMLKFTVDRMGDPEQPTDIYVFFDHEYPAPTRVYAQIFYHTPYRNLDRLPRYDFAVQKNGQLLVEQGQTSSWVLNVPLENGSSTEVPSGTRIDAVAKSSDGFTVASVGRNSGGWIRQIYLFSILFTLSSVFMMLLALANSLFGFLPEMYDFRLSARGSLSRRIHLWYVALLAVAFLVIGYLTYWHFTETARSKERLTLDYRSEAMLNNLKGQLLNTRVSADSLRRTLPRSLRSIATSMGMDANLYDQHGTLLFTTQEDLAALGILPSKMNADAWRTLKVGWQPEQIENEQVAGLQYQSKYLAIYNDPHTVLGYLGVPYRLSNEKAGAEVSDFLGMLASLYVFLLLIAYAVTFLLARSIVKPISMLSEKVRAVQLTDKNLPLEYAGDAQDEVSELIGQYNRMVDKLETSKVQLVRLEREGAWREMARQVAHDIKNPLTTMKLSMQQLERVSNNPEQAAAYLRKAITRLIEQIDSLAQIASEFSMFANLDIQKKNDVVINEVVESVHDLFSEQSNVDLSLALPDQRFHILGDKNHLIRVFNNLVINAIQAIPSDRRGHIHVSLTRRDNQAVIQISDNGGGIPEEIGERVFEPNFTTKTSGSGLGLAICKKIIEAHDGDIRFETRENEGTDFFVEIPVMAVE